ncbi:hypothetical protein BH23ACT2_BH23ACT2_14590 [soil metagenome]
MWAVGIALVLVVGVVAVLLARGSGDDPVAGQTGEVEIGGPAIDDTAGETDRDPGGSCSGSPASSTPSGSTPWWKRPVPPAPPPERLLGPAATHRG